MHGFNRRILFDSIQIQTVKMKQVKKVHGGGGEAMQDFIADFIKNFSLTKTDGGTGLESLDDSAIIPTEKCDLAFTTDSYTIDPIFFPGGDIGKLCVCGTVNDLAMMGAKPLALSTAFIIGEGFSIEDLDRITKSIGKTCENIPVPIVTGDTKVAGNPGIIITTSGIGITKKPIKDSGMKSGDSIIVTGTLGDHGMAIMATREGLSFETELRSDCMPLWRLIEPILGYSVHAMKDPTRGGLANTLNEMAAKSRKELLIYEEDIPLREDVVSASEMLGIDPLCVANEGKAVISAGANDADAIVKELRKHPGGENACIIGEVKEGRSGRVILETIIGGQRILPVPEGDPVPRVC